MVRSVSPATVRQLAAVLDARRMAEQVAFGVARDAADHAASEAEAAERDAIAAISDWRGYLDEPGFSPEFARALAARSTERVATAAGADTRRDAANLDREKRRSAWHVANARVAQTDMALARACRDTARELEERRIAAMADRVTFDRMKSR